MYGPTDCMMMVVMTMVIRAMGRCFIIMETPCNFHSQLVQFFLKKTVYIMISLVMQMTQR